MLAYLLQMVLSTGPLSTWDSIIVHCIILLMCCRLFLANRAKKVKSMFSKGSLFFYCFSRLILYELGMSLVSMKMTVCGGRWCIFHVQILHLQVCKMIQFSCTLGDAIVRELSWLSSNMYDILNRCETHHLIVGVLLQESFGPVFSSSDRNYGRLKSLCLFEGYPTVYT
jgi:hypothetical protein